MQSPTYSIVIPTRDRPETLVWAVRACLDPARDDYEIVVADNCSATPAADALRGTDVSRVRIVPADAPLSMTDNWERAVAAARGEWLILLGDDDGLLPGALADVDRLRQHFPTARAIRWSAAYYAWPNFPYPENAHYLRLPLGHSAGWVRFADLLPGVLDSRRCYTTLPMLYNSAVRRDVLDELVRRTGRVFLSSSPDVYSGVAIGHVVGQYVSCDYPLSVAGASGKSNGIANCFIGDGSPVKQDFDRLNKQAGHRTHPECPEPQVFPCVPVMDSYLHARDALFADSPYAYDRRGFLTECVKKLRSPTEAQWRHDLGLIQKCASDDPAWLALLIGSLSWTAPQAPLVRDGGPGFDGGVLHLEADTLGVTDVAAAARLCRQLLGDPTARLGRPRPEAATTDADLRAALLEKDSAIRSLTQRLHEERQVWPAELARRDAEFHQRLAEAVRLGSLRNVPRRLLSKFTSLLLGHRR